MNTVSSAHLGSSSPSQKAMKRARRPAKKALIANTTATTAGLSAQRTGAAGGGGRSSGERDRPPASPAWDDEGERAGCAKHLRMPPVFVAKSVRDKARRCE